jgi:hypothetical protein
MELVRNVLNSLNLLPVEIVVPLIVNLMNLLEKMVSVKYVLCLKSQISLKGFARNYNVLFLNT